MHNDNNNECWICCKAEPVNEFIRPCQCNFPVHKSCIEKWRSTSLTPEKYYYCPNCKGKFTTKKIKNEVSGDEIKNIQREYYCKVSFFIFFFLAFWMFIITLWSVFAWGCDKDYKNIPVFIKYIMSSIAYGFPSKNETAIWRKDFKDPDVKTWQYYGLFGSVITAICTLLLLWTEYYYTSEQSYWKKYLTNTQKYGLEKKYGTYFCCISCCICCHEYNDNNTCLRIENNRTKSCCDGNCGGNCGNCNCCCCDNCGNCNCSNCGNDACIFVLILVVIIIVIVLISAICVLIGFMVYKVSEYGLIYNKMIHLRTLENNGVIVICDRSEYTEENPTENKADLIDNKRGYNRPTSYRIV
jgi:hypothetical protein